MSSGIVQAFHCQVPATLPSAMAKASSSKKPNSQKARKSLKESAKSDKVKKRGQADPLTGHAWQSWMDHVARVGPTWLFVVFTLCHLLCCRVTEVLMLQLKDLDMDAKTVQIKALKRRGAILKPMSAPLVRMLKQWNENAGVSFTYTRKWGQRGVCTFTDKWKYPTAAESYFFPPKRCDNKMGRISKDLVKSINQNTPRRTRWQQLSDAHGAALCPHMPRA